MVGEERQEFLVKKDYLIDIEYFKCALKDGCWKEGRDNRIELPEDDPELWSLAIDFIMTNEFRPHVVPTCNCVLGELWCHDPEFDPPVQVIDADDATVDFNMADDQIGDWGYPDTTLVTLENLVGIFCLANKYLWRDLLGMCMEKIRLFPLGPAALPILAVTVGERKWCLGSEECWDEGLCDEYHELVRDAFRFHTGNYDSAPEPSHTLRDHSWQETPNPYEPLKEFFKANMTAEAWKAFSLLEDNRLEQKERIRDAMDARYWECSTDREGVCVVAWDKQAPDRLSARDLKRKQDAPRQRCQYQKERDAKMKDGCDSFTNTEEEKVSTNQRDRTFSSGMHNFAEAEVGDLITHIKDDGADGRYVTGLVIRTNRRGRFPRSVLRIFEQRSRKHCNGACCQPQTFKHNGRTLYHDDPLDEGIKLRKGRKSGGWQRTAGPSTVDHKTAVANVLRFGDGGRSDSEESFW